MITPPRRVTDSSRFSADHNQHVELSRSHSPLQSSGVRTSHTIHGVLREPEPAVRPYAADETSLIFHPFKIYNVANLIDTADSWRTFQVRSGYVGLRSKWGNTDGEWITPMHGNYEAPFMASRGSDKFFSTTPETLDFTTPVTAAQDSPENIILDGYTEGAAAGENSAQWVLCKDPVGDFGGDATAWIGAAFFARIVDTEPETRVEIRARMFSNQSGGGHPEFDVDPTMLPIGWVTTQHSGGPTLYYEPDVPATMTIHQMVFDNMLNRWPMAGNGTYRGEWVADSLDGQTFYPGDIVRYAPSGKFLMQTAYGQRTGFPSTGSDGWLQF